jgi:hypothetical protein
MEERQVTIDGVPHSLSPMFTVVATQNPVEFEGTYPLPEAELDRFATKIRIGYPDAQEEETILARHHEGMDAREPLEIDRGSIQADELASARNEASRVRVEPALLGYIATLARRTREWRPLRSEPVRARRFTSCRSRRRMRHRGRDYLLPDDVKRWRRRSSAIASSSVPKLTWRGYPPTRSSRMCYRVWRFPNDSGLLVRGVAARGTRGRRMAWTFGPVTLRLMLLGLLLLVPVWIDRRALAAVAAWDVIVIAAWLLDLIRLPKPAGLVMARSWAAAPTLGVPQAVRLDLTNEGTVTLHAWITDFAAPARRPVPYELAVTVAPGGTAAIQLRGRARRPRTRGQDLVAVRYRSALGLAERWARVSLPQIVRVYPDIGEAQRQALALIRARQIVMERRRARVHGLGRDFESLREFQEGDELRDVCWTATARRGRLVTRTYQPERSQTVWIVIDSGRLMRAARRPPHRAGPRRQRGVRAGAGGVGRRRPRRAARLRPRHAAARAARPRRTTSAQHPRGAGAGPHGSGRSRSRARRGGGDVGRSGAR